MNNFFFRVGQGSARPDLASFLQLNYDRFLYHFGKLFGLVVIYSPLYLLWLFKKERRTTGDLFFLLLLITPLTYFNVFMQQIQVHDFFTIYFAPFVAFAVAWICYRLSQAITFKPKAIAFSLQMILLAAVIFSSLNYNLSNRFILDGNINYGHLGRLVNQLTQPNDKIIAQIDVPDRYFAYFYLRRELGNLSQIKQPGFKYAILENRPNYYPSIRRLVKKYQTSLYRNYFIFDLTKPASKIKT